MLIYGMPDAIDFVDELLEMEAVGSVGGMIKLVEARDQEFEDRIKELEVYLPSV